MNRYIATIRQTLKSGKTRRVVRVYPAESMLIAALAAGNDLASNEELVGTMRQEGETFVVPDFLAAQDRLRATGARLGRLHR